MIFYESNNQKLSACHNCWGDSNKPLDLAAHMYQVDYQG